MIVSKMIRARAYFIVIRDCDGTTVFGMRELVWMNILICKILRKKMLTISTQGIELL